MYRGSLDWAEQMGVNERAETWKKALVMLEEVKVDPKKLKEIEGLVSQIMSDLEESVNLAELSDLRPRYGQNSLAIKLQCILENLREATDELEQLKKSLRSLCKRMCIERKIRAQIREQLRKTLQSLCKGKGG